MSTDFQLEDLNKRWFWVLMGPPILLGSLIWILSEFFYGFFIGAFIGILWGIGLSIASVCNREFRNWIDNPLVAEPRVMVIQIREVIKTRFKRILLASLLITLSSMYLNPRNLVLTEPDAVLFHTLVFCCLTIGLSAMTAYFWLTGLINS